MRAALLEAPGKPLSLIDDLEIEAPRHGEVRVAVKHCGLCHSDLSIIDGSFPAPLPIVLGHEAAGVVEEVGPGVERPDGSTRLSRGDERVYRGVGLGAFAESVLVPATGAVKVPAEVPLHVACVIGCAVQTGVGAVLNTAKVEEGATVLVMGLGGIGLSVVQGACIAGAARVIVSDPVAERREAAARFGATDLLDPGRDDVAARCKELTDVGVDYAFETAGRASLVETGVGACRKGGTTVCIGAPPLSEAITLAPAVLFTVSEKKLLGCVLGSSNSLREIPRLIGLWQAGRLDLEGLISSHRPIDEINEAAADLRASRGIRTVLAL
jgi:Zn-dependent alcohol dehydrogenase